MKFRQYVEFKAWLEKKGIRLEHSDRGRQWHSAESRYYTYLCPCYMLVVDGGHSSFMGNGRSITDATSTMYHQLKGKQIVEVHSDGTLGPVIDCNY